MPRKRQTNTDTAPFVRYGHGENLWGRQTSAEVRPLVTTRDVRAHLNDEERITHRPKNGVYDAVTYYHMVDLLAQLSPLVAFRTADLLPLLRAHKTQLVWDATTVGRVLIDVAESLADAYEVPAIRTVRAWNGMTYAMSDHPLARAALIRLIKDLRAQAALVVANELGGLPPKRTETPLLTCPSLMV